MNIDSEPPLSLLVGSQLDEIAAREADWAFHFGTGVTIVAEASHWRLVDSSRVIITDEDHCQWFGLDESVDAAELVSEELKGATVSGVQLSPVSDVLLSFSNGRTLQLLISSAGYENWHVYGPDGSHSFAIGGGELGSEVSAIGRNLSHSLKGPASPGS